MRNILTLIVSLAICWALPAAAGEAPLLTVNGAIATREAGRSDYRFSERALLALRQYTIKTSTTWTPQSEFSGPRLSEVLAKVGATGSQVQIHCLDGYSYVIPIAELARHQPILAHSMNGKALQTKDFGPLFLVYPRDQFPEELRTPVAEAKFAWQVTRLTVK